MTLQLDQLHGGRVTRISSKPKTKDTPEGISIRIPKDGEMVSEFMNPTALQSKVEWK